MHLVETDRIIIKAKYLIEEEETGGEIYSKDDGECVGTVHKRLGEETRFNIFPQYCEKQYIKEDCEKLKEEFESYALMWESRASRGYC